MATHRLFLKEDEHVEWSILSKINKSSQSRLIKNKVWNSLEEKMQKLCLESRSGQIRALAAREVLTIGGDKHLVWIDIDTYDKQAINNWLNEQHVLPLDSIKKVSSTTGKTHIYAVVDRPIKIAEQSRAYILLAETMPKKLLKSFDRLYGSESQNAIFLPMTSLCRATPPQELMRNVKGMWKVGQMLDEIRLKKNLEYY